MKFRHISISFGAGRYRPHTAGEVLVNQYGDCKDKHTLFAALLKAAGHSGLAGARRSRYQVRSECSISGAV
jgi:hypothetical protein